MDWTSLLSPASTVGTILTVIGFYLTWKTFKRQRFSYILESATLMNKTENAVFQDVEIRFQGKIINKLTSTKFIIWNSGNTVIKKEDLAPADQLRILLCNGAEILTFRITHQTNLINQLEALPNPNDHNAYNFNFDYFNQKDGFTGEIIHTGEQKDLNVCGTIIGNKKSFLKRKKYNKKEFRNEIINGIFILISGMLIPIMVYYSELITSKQQKFTNPPYFAFGLAFILLFIGIDNLFSIIRSRIPSSLQNE